MYMLINHWQKQKQILTCLLFQELRQGWTRVGDKKEYECQNKLADGTHTMYFERDRTKSDFSMVCDEFGKVIR